MSGSYGSYADSFESLVDPTPVEIAGRLDMIGYPRQAEKARSGDSTLMREAADWLRTEAGYVKSGAVELLAYSYSLRQAAEFEGLLG